MLRRRNRPSADFGLTDMTATSTRPIKILVQTTIRYAEDDWNINRFRLLRDHIASLTYTDGSPLAEVTARDREPDAQGRDPVLSTIVASDYDQVWLIAVDVGGDTGITAAECAALTEFRERGGALLATRDHQNLGRSIVNLGGLGRAHYFHDENPPPDPQLRARDDPYTTAIDWPNFHSGDNGDVQRVTAPQPIHPVLQSIATLPSHPHEGGVIAPSDDAAARVVVMGTSTVTKRPFNIGVAFESTNGEGRGWAESTFHHFADYNWNVRAGCPSFVTETPSNAIAKNPALLADTKQYVRNLVEWLGRRPR